MAATSIRKNTISRSSLSGASDLLGIKKTSNLLINFIMLLLCLVCLYPLCMVLAVSFTDEKTISEFGYRLLPARLSLKAYQFIFSEAGSVLQAYGVTILVTITGSSLSLLITAMYAYPLSRRDFPHKKFFSFFIFFTLLFNSGLVPWYMVYTNVLRIKDTLLALILPGLVTPLYVLIMRTFFATTIPEEIFDAAKIDGAGEFRTFFQIVVPVATPSLATIGLFNVLFYWNDWYSPLLFINNKNLFNLQYLMYKIENNLDFLLKNIPQGVPMNEILAGLPSQSVSMAMAIITIGPIIFAYPLFQRYFIAGLTVGSVKG